MSDILLPEGTSRLAHPIHEYFAFIAPPEGDNTIYFKFTQGRYEDTVFHYVFSEEFDISGQYKVILDLVPKRFGEKDVLKEDLCQYMVKEFLNDILKEALTKESDVRLASDSDSHTL